MSIYPLTELPGEQKRKLYQFIGSFEYKSSYRSYEDIVKYCEGIIFDNGKSYFSLWENNNPVGTIGVVSKDASVRGEIFLVSLNIRECDNDKLAPLLSKAFEYCKGYRNVKYRLSIMYDRYYLIPFAEKSGFSEANRNLKMGYNGNDISLSAEESKCFKSLSPENIKDFQRVHNAAFLQAPNGAMIEDSELQGYLEEFINSSLAGIYCHAGVPAGVYILKLNGSNGYIDGIGVAPEFQGRGIGKKLLNKSVGILQSAGADKVELSVFNINTRALGLYLKNGFQVESEHSIWFEK